MTPAAWTAVVAAWCVVAAIVSLLLGLAAKRLKRAELVQRPAYPPPPPPTVVNFIPVLPPVPPVHDWQDELPVDALSDVELADRLHRIEVAEGWTAA